MAIKPFNSVAGFSVGETPANIILANGRITTNGADFTANITALGVLTDNLYYANGTPWDLSDPGGSNTAIQFNDDESFGGSTAFTFDKDTANLDLTGNITVSTGIITGDGAGISNIAAGNIVGLDLSSISNINYIGTKIWADHSVNLYPYGYPYSFVSNQIHQYILIFKKAS